MNRQEIENFIEIQCPDHSVVLADDLDEAFVGIDSEDENPRAVYSIDKCIEILSEDMSKEEASEYFWYNVAGASGEGSPLFIYTPIKEKDESPYS